MTKPSASPRQALAPGDTVNGNVKVGEPGLFGGNSGGSCASPTAGASASAAVHIAVASFMENLLLLRMYRRHAVRPKSARWWSSGSAPRQHSSALSEWKGQLLPLRRAQRCRRTRSSNYGILRFVNFSCNRLPKLPAKRQTEFWLIS